MKSLALGIRINCDFNTRVKIALIAPQSQSMPNLTPPTSYRLAQLLFLPLLAFLLFGCSTYKKVYTNDPNKQVRRRADISLRW